MKKLLILFLAALIIITGCQKASTKELAVRITWEAGTGRGNVIQSIIDDFNFSHEDLHVTMLSGNEDSEAIAASFDEKAADVYVLPYRYIKGTFDSELLDLTGRFDDELSNIHPSIKDLCVEENSTYGVPWLGHSMALIYNKTLTDSIDVDPQTWDSMDDLITASEKLSEELAVGGLGLIGKDCHDLTWMMSQFIYSFGGSLVKLDDQGNYLGTALNSDSTANALDYYINKLGPYAQEGWQDHDGLDIISAFGAQEIAFEIQGPWGITDIWKNNNPFEIGVIPLKQIGLYSEVGPLILCVSKDTKHPEEAMALIHYLLGTEAMDQVLDGEYDAKYDAYYPFRIPISTNSEKNEFFTRYPEFKPFLQGFEMPSINTPTKEWLKIKETDYPYYLHKAIIGEVTIKEALEALEQ